MNPQSNHIVVARRNNFFLHYITSRVNLSRSNRRNMASNDAHGPSLPSMSMSAFCVLRSAFSTFPDRARKVGRRAFRASASGAGTSVALCASSNYVRKRIELSVHNFERVGEPIHPNVHSWTALCEQLYQCLCGYVQRDAGLGVGKIITQCHRLGCARRTIRTEKETDRAMNR